MLARFALVPVLGAALLAGGASASAPDLTLTELTYDRCLASASDRAAEITVARGQGTLLAQTSDLRQVYATLAALADVRGVRVVSNAAGTRALRAAQTCLASRAPTVGAGRMHQLRRDLRCVGHLMEHGGVTFSTFTLAADGWASFAPDGVPSPTCDQRRHVMTYPLANGDRAAGWVSERRGEQVTSILRVTCHDNGCEGGECGPVVVSGPMGAQPGCACAGTGALTGCLGSTSLVVRDTMSTCWDALF